jgi:hypothetical protein
MSRRTCWLLLLVAACLACASPGAPGPRAGATELSLDEWRLAEELIANFMGHLRDGRFSEASALFHLPVQFSALQREREAWEIAESLRLALAHLGEPDVLGAAGGAHELTMMEVRSGDPAYWRERLAHHPIASVAFAVEFAEAGAGFLTLQAVSLDGTWQLFRMVFALPEAQPGATETMSALEQELRARLQAGPPRP